MTINGFSLSAAEAEKKQGGSELQAPSASPPTSPRPARASPRAPPRAHPPNPRPRRWRRNELAEERTGAEALRAQGPRLPLRPLLRPERTPPAAAGGTADRGDGRRADLLQGVVQVEPEAAATPRAAATASSATRAAKPSSSRGRSPACATTSAGCGTTAPSTRSGSGAEAASAAGESDEAPRRRQPPPRRRSRGSDRGRRRIEQLGGSRNPERARIVERELRRHDQDPVTPPTRSTYGSSPSPTARPKRKRRRNRSRRPRSAATFPN